MQILPGIELIDDRDHGHVQEQLQQNKSRDTKFFLLDLYTLPVWNERSLIAAIAKVLGAKDIYNFDLFDVVQSVIPRLGPETILILCLRPEQRQWFDHDLFTDLGFAYHEAAQDQKLFATMVFTKPVVLDRAKTIE